MDINKEIVTIVNNNNKIIGYIPRFLNQSNLVRIAATLVFRSNGKIIISQISENKKVGAGMWTYSSAGHVEKEPIEKAAIRELKEELGIEAKLDSFLGISRIKDKSFHYVYKVIYDGAINFDKFEIADVKELSIEEIDNLIKETPEKFTENFKIIFKKITIAENK